MLPLESQKYEFIECIIESSFLSFFDNIIYFNSLKQYYLKLFFNIINLNIILLI